MKKYWAQTLDDGGRGKAYDKKIAKETLKSWGIRGGP